MNAHAASGDLRIASPNAQAPAIDPQGELPDAPTRSDRLSCAIAATCYPATNTTQSRVTTEATMAAPNDTSTPADVIAYDFYLISRLEADAEVAVHAAVVQPPLDKLLKSLGVRIVAHNAVLKIEAKTDFARDKMLDALVPLALHAAATIGSKDSPLYKRIFTRTPIGFAAVPQKDLVKEMAAIDKALHHEATPVAVLKHGQPFLDARKAWLAAEDIEAKALDTLKSATEGVHAAKKECIIATSRVRSRLSDQFAGESKKVLRYFRTSNGKAKPVVLAAVPVVPVAAIAAAVAEPEAEAV